MKGIVFTLDALFALMIAAAGITVILYFVYSAPTPTFTQYSSSSAIVSQLASTKLSAISGIPIVQQIINQSNAYNQSWPQLLNDPYSSGGNKYGPSLGLVSYTLTTPGEVENGTIVADYGNIYFGSGNIIYAINATTGAVLWTAGAPYNTIYSGFQMYCLSYRYYPGCVGVCPPKCSSPAINSTAVYDGMLIYTTDADIVAINAHNGSTIWDTPVQYTGNLGDSYYNTMTGLVVNGEPDADELPELLLVYDGKIITRSADSQSAPDGVTLYALYANNGTIVGQTSSFPTSLQYISAPSAIIDGKIATAIYYQPKSGPVRNLGTFLLTNFYNHTSEGAVIWQQPWTPLPPLGGYTDIATYGNTIGIGEAGDEDLFALSNALVKTVGNPGGVTSYASGVSSYNGHFVFQTGVGSRNGYVVSLSSSGAKNWPTVTAPVQYGEPLRNATPIQSSQNIYTAWQNGFVASQNQSTGSFINGVNVVGMNGIINYGIINPHMALAYGKLYVSMGNTITAFGTCQGDSNSSILTMIGTLYINNQGSCADYILNSITSTTNSTFVVNNESIVTTSKFNGANSVVTIPYSYPLDISAPFTISLWFSSNVLATKPVDTELFYTSQSRDALEIMLDGGASPGIYGSVGDGARWLSTTVNYPFSFTRDAWYNLVAVYTDSGWSLYLNGNEITGSYSGMPSLLGDSPTSSIQLGQGSGTNAVGTTPFKGSIANLQIYNTSLSSVQARQLYDDGISGGPVTSKNLLGWFPLAGDANGYSNNNEFPGFDSQVSFQDVNYNVTAIQNAYSLTSQTVPVILLNYSTGKYGLYNIGIYSWK